MNTQKPSKETVLYQSPFIFNAHHEKAFRKLKENQFPRIAQGLIHEPLSNAIDQQPPGIPVVVRFRRLGDRACIWFRDQGEGLQATNLEALHLIGHSTKRDDRGTFIGRFGMGLIGAFHHKLGVEQVRIDSNICGQPGRIMIDVPPDGTLPQWDFRALDRPIEGLRISFHFPADRFSLVHRELDRFFKDSLISVIYNGKWIDRQPMDLIRRDGDLAAQNSGDDPRVYLSTPMNEGPTGFKRDDLRIYLRKMLVEKASSAYHVFQTTAGDKMPQNYWDTPYLDQESIIVLSDRGEPTVGRDQLVRDTAFDEIKLGVRQARASALAQLIRFGLGGEADQRIRNNAVAHVRANLKTLADPIKRYLNGSTLDRERYLSPLIDLLLNASILEVYGSKRQISLREILETPVPGNYVFCARDEYDADQFAGSLNVPFILQETVLEFDSLWGYHRKEVIHDIVKPILAGRESGEVIDLHELRWEREKQFELERLGLLHREPIRIRRHPSPTTQQAALVERLRELLNQPWVRSALSRFDPPRRIRLVPIQEEGDTRRRGEVVAAVTGHDPRHGELTLGINVDSTPLQSLANDEGATPAFLPILCHELAHQTRKVEDEGDGLVQASRSFHVDRIRMEDTLLQACIARLTGADAPTASIDDGLESFVVL